MYNSGNSSKNVTGASIVDGTVETVDIADDAVTADKLANSVNTDIATGVSGSTTAGDALPKTGGAMTGAITTNSTFDGVDVATRDGVLTTTTATANDALPKAGGTMTGNLIVEKSQEAKVTINSTTTGVGSGVVLGSLEFESQDSNGPGLQAKIDAFTENTVGSTAMRFFSSYAFGATPAEAMRIDAVGNVLVGATSPPGTSTTGFGVVDAGGSGLKTIFSSSSTTTAVSMARWYNPNGNVGSIQASGSATSYNTSSDYRLKENVVPMTGSIDRLKALKPSKFNFIADADTTVDGFLAHEAGNVVPECATGTKDAMTVEVLYTADDELPEGKNIGDVKEASVPDYQGIDQSKLVPLLVSALQEAIARIETLENV